jgi:3-oxoacyl-[acyl-carrier-protein] synthase III
MPKPVYITSIGAFLPGDPVTNEDMERHLGQLGSKTSRVKERVLRDNGIKTRYYSVDREQNTRFTNAQMAKNAIDAALKRVAFNPKDVGYLAAATSQPDLPLPGFASQVHALTEITDAEIAAFQSICSSGVMALKGAYHAVAIGEAKSAVACASEVPSRLFKASRFSQQKEYLENGRMPFDTEFLRWMLSDGAGAVLMQDRPNASGLSLRVDWIRMKSYANKYPICMYVGAEKNAEGEIGKGWLDYPDYQNAAVEGIINLRQDVRLLPEVIKTGIEFYFSLINEGLIKPNEIDHFLPHYSSEVFRQPIKELMERAGALIPEEKWFTNLHYKGNTGAASIYIMLEELFNERELKAGQRILCHVPESGRFNFGFMQFTVVDGANANVDSFSEDETIEAPVLEVGAGPVQQRLVRELTSVWVDFERELHNIPLIRRIRDGGLHVDDYKKLLRNLRAQVVEGSRWITRAASSLSDPRLLEIRSIFIHHAKEEHRDYLMLEKNFLAVGGTPEEIQNPPKNIGSEALSAWMLQKAGRENPVDLLGAMFIIEGLGNRVARYWGERIRDQLNLTDEQVSFFLYHGDNDENHFDRLEDAINSEFMTNAIVDEVVKTAKVTARLYRLQLEELDRF